jgi:hypothetical protein
MTPALPRLAARLRIAADYAAFRHDARARFTTSAAVTPTRTTPALPRSAWRRHFFQRSLTMLPDHDLQAARRLAESVRPFAWSADHMRESHYEMAAEAMSLLPDLLAEIDQHRARIAAHAATHPERLSDGEVNEIVAAYEDEPAALEDALDADTIAQLAIEIQQRRAADLTPPQIDQVRAMLRDAVADRPIVCGPERVDILRDILRAHGAA